MTPVNMGSVKRPGSAHQEGQNPWHPAEMKLYTPPSPSGAIGYWGGNTKLNELIVVDPGKIGKDGVSVAPKVRCLDEQIVTKVDYQVLPQI